MNEVLEYSDDQIAEMKVKYDGTKSERYGILYTCLLYTSPSPRDRQKSRMPSSA